MRLEHTPQTLAILEKAGVSLELNRFVKECCRTATADAEGYFQALRLGSIQVNNCEMLDRLATHQDIRVLTPFLSTPIVELARYLPSSLKVHHGVTKPVLRHLYGKYLPGDGGQVGTGQGEATRGTRQREGCSNGLFVRSPRAVLSASGPTA